MSGSLTTQVIDKTLRAHGLEPWSPENRNGWTVYMRDAWFIVTGNVGDALAMYRPEPCAEGIRLRAQRAQSPRHDAVVAPGATKGSERHEGALASLPGALRAQKRGDS